MTDSANRPKAGPCRPCQMEKGDCLSYPWKAIAAMSLNRVIGRGREIPWHLPEDFQWFKRTTYGHILAMGRRTFEAIGRPLPGRTTYVLSRSGFSFPGVEVIGELNELPPPGDGQEVFICGGAQIYEQAFPHCSDLFLTRVKREVAGDVFFPFFEEQFGLERVLRETPEFSIEHYRRRERIAAANR